MPKVETASADKNIIKGGTCMSQINNVIDFTQRLKARKEKSKTTYNATMTEIVDISEKRKEILSQERRDVKRTILTEFIGAFVIVPQIGLVKVAIYDISETGIAIDIDQKYGQFVSGEEIALRVYLNHKTYFPFYVKINNVRDIDDEGVIRHGAHFIPDSVNEEALSHFVKFIETVSASLETDMGDVMVSNLNK